MVEHWQLRAGAAPKKTGAWSSASQYALFRLSNIGARSTQKRISNPDSWRSNHGIFVRLIQLLQRCPFPARRFRPKKTTGFPQDLLNFNRITSMKRGSQKIPQAGAGFYLSTPFSSLPCPWFPREAMIPTTSIPRTSPTEQHVKSSMSVNESGGRSRTACAAGVAGVEGDGVASTS